LIEGCQLLSHIYIIHTAITLYSYKPITTPHDTRRAARRSADASIYYISEGLHLTSGGCQPIANLLANLWAAETSHVANRLNSLLIVRCR